MALYEKIALLERRIKSMNQSTGRLQARMEAQRYDLLIFQFWKFSGNFFFWNFFFKFFFGNFGTFSSEKTIKLRALTQWRQATRERIEEKKLSKLSSMMYKRLLMRRYFNQWASAVKSKWKSKVEKGILTIFGPNKKLVLEYFIRLVPYALKMKDFEAFQKLLQW